MNQQLDNIQFDSNSLVKEEVYTDQKIGSIRILIPVTNSGQVDESRKKTFHGQTQFMTPGGALPLNFNLEVDNLADAIESFGDAAKESMQQTMKEIEEYQKEQASKIVIPGQNPASNIQLT